MNVKTARELAEDDAATDPAAISYADGYKHGEVCRETKSTNTPAPSSNVINLFMDAAGPAAEDNIVDAWQDGFDTGLAGREPLTPVQVMIAYD